MPLLLKNALVQGDQHRAIPVTQISSHLSVAEEDAAVEHWLAEQIKTEREKAQSQALEWLAIHKEEFHATMEAEAKKRYEASAREGHKAGWVESKEEAGSFMAEIRQCYQILEDDRRAFVLECQQEIHNLVFGLVEQVLRKELTTSNEALAALVSQATAELADKSRVVLFVHPSRVREVEPYFSQIKSTESRQSYLVRSDPTLDVASFRVEDAIGAVWVDLPDILTKLKLIVS